MSKLTKKEKIKLLQHLETKKYEGGCLCVHIALEVEYLYNIGRISHSIIPFEIIKLIHHEGGEISEGKSWTAYSDLIRDLDECRAFREEVLQKIINLKNEL